MKGVQYLTKPAFKEKETQLSKLETTLGKVKKQLAKGDKGKVNITKDLLKEAVAYQKPKRKPRSLSRAI